MAISGCFCPALAALAMLLYEGYWIRYFRSRQEMTDFYSSFLGIPVAGASLPVAAFSLLGIYGRNPLMLLAVTVLGKSFSWWIFFFL